MITLQPTYLISPAELKEIACEYGEFLTLEDARRWARAYSVMADEIVWAVWHGRIMEVCELVLQGRVFKERSNE